MRGVGRCLIVAARAPRAGRVKTRLARELGAQASLRLYKAFLRDVFEATRLVRCEEKVMAYAGRAGLPFLRRVFRGFVFLPQRGADLGARLSSVVSRARARGAGRIVIIGSDAPTLPASYVNRAFRGLAKSDIVLGPARDGGYYLIGFKGFPAGIFKDIDWGTERVWLQTMSRARALRKRVTRLPRWYDVDDRDGLEMLIREAQRTRRPCHTAHVLSGLKISRGQG